MNKKIEFIRNYQLPVIRPVLEAGFDYKIVDKQYVNTAEEEYHTKTNTITVGVTSTLARVWYLNSQVEGDGLLRVMAEYAKRYIKRKILMGNLLDEEKLELTTYNVENPKCRFDHNKLPPPDGMRFEAEENEGGINMFEEIMNDVVVLVKLNGQRFENIRACVQPKLILIDDATLPIEEGDRLLRNLPSGLTETYVVEDRGFNEAFIDFPAHYQIKARKETNFSAPGRASSITYNLHGANPRVNINSHDESVNVLLTQDNVFDELRNVIGSKITDKAEREQIIQSVEEMEKAKGTDGFVSKYQRFIEVASKHMALVGPFIPILATFLGMK